MSQQQAEVVIACNIEAIPAAERETHSADGHALFATVQEVREDPDGYSFRLPTESDMLFKAASFISYERLCCSFFGFAFEVEPRSTAFWLRLYGNAEIKAFIKTEFGVYLDPKVAEAAGFISR